MAPRFVASDPLALPTTQLSTTFQIEHSDQALSSWLPDAWYELRNPIMRGSISSVTGSLKDEKLLP